MIPSKSLSPELSKVFDHVPQSLLPHFVRGIFDGDGSGFVDGRGKTVCEFSGSVFVLEKIRDILVEECGVCFNALSVDKKADPLFRKVRWRHPLDVWRISKWMYEGAEFYAERKAKALLELEEKPEGKFSCYRGVNFVKNKWTASVYPGGRGGKTVCLGRFDTELEAALAWDNYMQSMFGEAKGRNVVVNPILMP